MRKTAGKKRAAVKDAFTLIDVHDWRVAMFIGFTFGALVVGLPKLLGVTILVGAIMFALKLVSLGRL